MKVMSPDDPQFQRRQKYRALQNNPALKRPFPGRPKSHNPKYPVRAESKRVACVKKKVVHLVQTACEKAHQVKKQNPDTWDKAFGKSPVDTLFQVVRQVGKTAAGARMMPTFAKTENTRQMFEQTGKGACEMIKQVAGGKARAEVKASLTRFCTKYVTALGLFREEVGMTRRYLSKSLEYVEIARWLTSRVDLREVKGGELPTFKGQHSKQLIQIVECFFLRNSNTRSGDKVKREPPFERCP